MQGFIVSVHGQAALRRPPADDVQVELERIISSTGFPASNKRRAFLRFIVEETLAGRTERLKGYTVAVSVFGRDETFDSQADPVVRLEARRLRRDLDSYYVGPGKHDRVRISIPKGSYVPQFEWSEATQPPAVAEIQAPGVTEPAPAGITGAASGVIVRRQRRYVLIAAAVAAVFVVVLAAWLLHPKREDLSNNTSEHGPSVVVLPFAALSPNGDGRYLAAGISQELINNLMRFPSFRLYTLPVSFRNEPNAEPAPLGRGLGVSYVVTGSVTANSEDARVAAQVLDANTGRVVWTHTYDRPMAPDALIDVQSNLAGEIAAAIGQPYGVIRTDLKNRIANLGVSSMQSYICVLRGYTYRRNFSRKDFEPVLACLEEAVRRDPGYSDAWAMLGWLHVDAGRLEYPDYDTNIEYDKALQAATEAVRLAPNSILALKVLAAVYHYRGHYNESEELTRKALELNPYDPEALAQLGWRLAVRGNFEEGIPLLKRAIARTANPPGWYYHLIEIDLFLRGKYGEMLRVAERSDPDNSGFTQFLLALANGALGNGAATRDALDKLNSSQFKSLALDPAAFIRRHGATENIVSALMAGFEKAKLVAEKP